MSLIELWNRSRAEVLQKKLHQVIAFAGTGKLKDGDDTSREFREFLGSVPSSLLATYANECLQASFPDSGLALQDVVNEVGRRLGFAVTHGMYRGRVGAVGFDGLWRMPLGHVILIEVKTTDAFRIDLEVVAGYRSRLIDSGALSLASSSMLVVVGRQDTGDLEAQVRGSRHAWDVRLISVDSLLRLLRVKEAVDEPATVSRIHTVLTPREFTRLDGIVDVVFSAAADGQEEVGEREGAGLEVAREVSGSGNLVLAQSVQAAVVERLENTLGQALVRRSRSNFSSPDEKVRVSFSVGVGCVSGVRKGYSHTLHSYQVNYLRGGDRGVIVFAGNDEEVIALPFETLDGWLSGLVPVELSERVAWPILLLEDGEGGWALSRRDGKMSFSIEPVRMGRSRT